MATQNKSAKADKAPTLTVARAMLRECGQRLMSAAADGASASQRVCVELATAERLYSAVPKLFADGQALVSWQVRHTERYLRADEVSQYLTAGRVYLTLSEAGAMVDASVSKSALGTLHKLLSAPANKLKGLSGAEAVLAVWQAASSADGTATIASVQAVLAKRFPDVEGSRGPKSGTESASGNGKAKAGAKAKAPAENKPESGTQRVTDSRKNASLTALNRILSAFEATGHNRLTAWKFAEKVLSVCERQGCEAARIALTECEPKSEAPKAPKRKPKAQNTNAPKRSRAKATA